MNVRQAPRVSAQAEKEFSAGRRKVLLRLGAFAAYTAPVMTSLMVSGEARAQGGGLNPCNRPNPPPACGVTPDPCDSPNPPPICLDPCESANPPPGCEVGSMSAGASAQQFSQPPPSDDWNDSPADF